MIPASFDYVAPITITEAITLLETHGPDARLLAGGHSLLPQLKQRHLQPKLLVDLGRIAKLRGIDIQSDTVALGALTTHAEVEYHPALHAIVPLLPQAAHVVSDPLIRNSGTLGGALAQADAEGDWPAVMLALDAQFHVTGPNGDRTIAARSFFLDTQRIALQQGEILHTIMVPIESPVTRSVYLKRMYPASGYAVIGVAIVATVDRDNTVTDCRIGTTGAGRVAVRATTTEQVLLGRPLTTAAIAEAASYAVEGITFIGDQHVSAAFRRHLVAVYVRRALQQLSESPSPSLV